jgi:hypothetical protein
MANALTRLVAKLEACELIARQPDTDGRGWQVALTPEDPLGRRQIRKPVAAEVVQCQFSRQMAGQRRRGGCRHQDLPSPGGPGVPFAPPDSGTVSGPAGRSPDVAGVKAHSNPGRSSSAYRQGGVSGIRCGGEHRHHLLGGSGAQQASPVGR